MKLVLDPKIKDVQFITAISQPYDGVPRALALCAIRVLENASTTDLCLKWYYEDPWHKTCPHDGTPLACVSF